MHATWDWRVNKLQTLPVFNIRKGSWHCEISELKGLVNLRGELTITGLRNVTSIEGAKEANFQNKEYLQVLTLDWFNETFTKCDHYNDPSVKATGTGHEKHVNLVGNIEEEVIESLQPN
jgi:hypothetical protein